MASTGRGVCCCSGGSGCICLVISYVEACKTITAHQLEPIKTGAKEDYRKIYWIHSAEEKEEVYKKKHILFVQPSIVLAKNIKQEDPVFALINCELIDGVLRWQPHCLHNSVVKWVPDYFANNHCVICLN